MIKLLTDRQWRLFRRDKALTNFRIVQVIVVGLIVGSLFSHLGHTPDRARSYFGVSFLCIMFLAMGSAIQMAIIMQTKGCAALHYCTCHGRAYLPTCASAALAQAKVRNLMCRATRGLCCCATAKKRACLPGHVRCVICNMLLAHCMPATWPPNSEEFALISALIRWSDVDAWAEMHSIVANA